MNIIFQLFKKILINTIDEFFLLSLIYVNKKIINITRFTRAIRLNFRFNIPLKIYLLSSPINLLLFSEVISACHKIDIFLISYLFRFFYLINKLILCVILFYCL